MFYSEFFQQRIITVRITILRACVQHSHLRLCSWLCNVYQKLLRPSNGLSELTGSIRIALQEQRTHPQYLSRQKSYDSSFFTATAYRSEAFSGSLSHTNDSLTATSNTCLYAWQPQIQPFLSKSLPWRSLYTFLPPDLACLSLRARAARKPITLLQMLCCKIFVLKYFRKTLALQKIFNTKIFPMKISCNENFPIYGNHNTIQLDKRSPL